MFTMTANWDRASRTGSRPSNHVLRVRLASPNGAVTGDGVRFAVALDTSGSMEGTKIEKAKQACTALASQLRPCDTISICTFACDMQPILNNVRGGEGCLEAVSGAIANVHASGTTQMWLAMNWLETTLSATAGSAKAGVLITDGEPTDLKGESLKDFTSLLDIAGHMGSKDIVLTAVGLGAAEDFNTALLASISERGHGAFVYSEDPGDLSRRIQQRLFSSQNTDSESFTVEISPASDCAKIQRACVIAPEYREVQLIGTQTEFRIPVGTLRCDVPNDVLVMVETAPEYGVTGDAVREVAKVKLIDCRNNVVGESRMSITHTSSFAKAQAYDADIDRARILWEINLRTAEVLTATDPSRCTAPLEDIAFHAARIGEKGIEALAASQLEQLRETGLLNARKTASLVDITRNTGGLS